MFRIVDRVSRHLRRHRRLGGWALTLVPDIPITIRIDPIGRFRIRLRRNRSFWLRDPLTHERSALAALQSLVRAGSTVYDVGANIGLYVRFLVGAFGAKQVVAFEPMTENRGDLARNVALGAMGDRALILPHALSDSDGEALFQIDDIMSGSAALDEVTGGAAAVGRRLYGFRPRTEIVQCRRLDSLLGEGDLPLPDVIKVDVEGAEHLVLSGAIEFLRAHSPRLFIELHGAEKARQVVRFLWDLGYACRGKVRAKVDPSGFVDVDESRLADVTDYYDMFFVVASKDPDELPSHIQPYYPG